MQPVMIPCLDPDRPLNAEELADEAWERRQGRVRTRAHIEHLEAATEREARKIAWDSLTPEQKDACGCLDCVDEVKD